MHRPTWRPPLRPTQRDAAGGRACDDGLRLDEVYTSTTAEVYRRKCWRKCAQFHFILDTCVRSRVHLLGTGSQQRERVEAWKLQLQARSSANLSSISSCLVSTFLSIAGKLCRDQFLQISGSYCSVSFLLPLLAPYVRMLVPLRIPQK